MRASGASRDGSSTFNDSYGQRQGTSSSRDRPTSESVITPTDSLVYRMGYRSPCTREIRRTLFQWLRWNTCKVALLACSLLL